MANIKFSGFTEVTSISGVQEIVGYNGTQNVRITPANLLSSLPGGPFLPLAGGTMTGNILFNSSVRAQFGSGGNSEVFFTGSNFVASTFTGDFIISNYANDKDIIFQSDDGSGGVTEYFKLNGFAVRTDVLQNFRVQDNILFQAGSSGDFNIRHNGTDSYLENDTGDLYIKQNKSDADIIFQSDDGAGGEATYFYLDGSGVLTRFDKRLRMSDAVSLQLGSSGNFEMYHLNGNTTMDNFTGDLTIRNSANDKDILFACDDGAGGGANYIKLDGSATTTVFLKNTRHDDNVIANFGGNNDLQIYHDGTNSAVNNLTGDLYIMNASDDKDIIFQSDDGSGGVATYFKIDGSSTDIQYFKNLVIADNAQIQVGNSGDLRIYHDGSNSYINDTGTGNLRIRSTSLRLEGSNASNMIVANQSGVVQLYYNGSPKIATTNTGVEITGGITDSNGDLGTAGQLLSSTGTALDWIDAPSGGAAIDSTYTPKAGQMPRWINGTTIGGGITGDMYPSTGTSTTINRGYTSEFLYPKLTAPFKHTGWWQTGFEVGSLSTLESMSPFDVTNFILWDIQASNSPIDFTGSGTSAVKDSIMIGNGFAQQVISTSGGRMDGNILMCMGPQTQSFLERCQGKNVQNSVVIGGRVLDSGSFSGNGLSGAVIIGGETFEQGNITDIDNGVFIGREQGKGSTGTGLFNNYVGYRAMGGKVNGTANTAMGYLSGFDIGSATTSNYNAFYGASAGQEHVSGDYNTFIGYASGPTNNAASTGSNNTAIGNGAQFSAAATSNEIVLGNSSVTALKCQVQTITALSDERDKSDIVDLNYGLDLVMNLKPKKFVWDLRDEVVIDIEEKIIPGKDGEKDITEVIETPRTVKPTTSGLKDVGFIAQELKEIDNDFLRLVNSSNPEKLQASYSRLLPVLVKAIQELSAKVTDLENA